MILSREEQISIRSFPLPPPPPKLAMDNSTVIPLEGRLLLVTQLELVIPTTVAGTLYGIAFTLFCLYVHSLSPRLRAGDRKRQARFMLGFSSIIMLCGLYILIANTWVVQDAYIKHHNYPGGPYPYEASILHTAIIIVLISCWLVVDTLTSAIQVHCFISLPYASHPG
jgi:hypothetical protein